MILLILSLANLLLLKTSLLKLIIALIIFIIVEVKRKNGSATKPMIVAEFASAIVIVAFIVLFIIGLVAKYKK